jgi:hypothetical protein
VAVERRKDAPLSPDSWQSNVRIANISFSGAQLNKQPIALSSIFFQRKPTKQGRDG